MKSMMISRRIKQLIASSIVFVCFIFISCMACIGYIRIKDTENTLDEWKRYAREYKNKYDSLWPEFNQMVQPYNNLIAYKYTLDKMKMEEVAFIRDGVNYLFSNNEKLTEEICRQKIKDIIASQKKILDNTKDTVAKVKKERDDTKDALTRVKKECEDARNARVKVEKERDAFKDTLDKVKKELKDAKGALENKFKAEKERDETKAVLAKVKKELEDANETLAKVKKELEDVKEAQAKAKQESNPIAPQPKKADNGKDATEQSDALAEKKAYSEGVSQQDHHPNDNGSINNHGGRTEKVEFFVLPKHLEQWGEGDPYERFLKKEAIVKMFIDNVLIASITFEKQEQVDLTSIPPNSKNIKGRVLSDDYYEISLHKWLEKYFIIPAPETRK